MLKKTYNNGQVRIQKAIAGMMGILFLFQMVSCGSKDTTSPSPGNPDPTPPSAVGGLTVASFTTNQVMLSWTAPAETGIIDGTNAPLSHYVVKYKKSADTNSPFTPISHTNNDGVRLTAALTATNTDATVIGLSPGTSYTFLVAAVNSDNRVIPDTEASTVEMTTLVTPPSAVRDLTVVPFTTNQVVLSWAASTNTGIIDGTNAPLSHYVVKYKKSVDTNSPFTQISHTNKEGVRLTAALTANSSNATVIGLGPGTYTFLVAAVNSGNQVTPDAESSTVEMTIILPPENLKQTQCDKATSADLAWDASIGATSYKVYRVDAQGNTNIITHNTTSYTDTGLTPGNTYTYKVRACKDADCSDDSNSLEITTITLNDKSFKGIIEAHEVPADLSGYDERSREIFSPYPPNVCVVAKYLKPGGTGDGSSFDNAAGNLKSVLEGITNASDNQVYAVLLTGGTYTNGGSVSMKNHVAIIGGVDEDLGFSETVTALDGNNSYRVFYNNKNGLDKTALLYGVTVTNGEADQGGGMYNNSSSPDLVEVTFSGNTATESGGGIYNHESSPSLDGVTFSENTATYNGGGMFNESSSPTLKGVTFSGNTAIFSGGGMFNTISSPTLVGVTFSGNSAEVNGGGMNNIFSSSPILEGVTFSGNTAREGGGMYNFYNSSPILVEVTFSGNTANYGGGMYIENNAEGPFIINAIFWGNTATFGGPQFYFNNYNQETLRIYNSIVQGGTGTLKSGTTNTSVNQGGFGSGNFFGDDAPIVISFSNISAEDPKLLPLANNGGEVWTHAIAKTSPAVNQGLYVKRKATTVDDKTEYTLYYSTDKSTWYTQPDLSGTSVTPPADAVDVTATDATGYTRTDRPDLGAYEAR